MNDKIKLPKNARLVDGVLHQILRPGQTTDPRPALFLDRDGCVVVESHYLRDVENVQLIEGASEVIARANGLDLVVVLVTNQAGIGRGYFGWPEFFQVQHRILSELARGGAHIDGVYACPYRINAQPPYDHPDHPSRKPNPGMLISAAAELNLELGRSWIVGDRAADLQAGLNAGLAGGVQVATGHGAREGERQAALALNSEEYRALTADSIAQVSRLVDLFH